MIRTLKTIETGQLNEIMAIWLKTNIEAHDFIESEYWESNYSFVENAIKQSHIKVYTDRAEIVGFIGLSEEYIAGIFVKHEYRKKGIGKQLLDAAKNEHEKLYLSVYKNNTHAVNFYLRQGFNIAEEVRDEKTDQIEYQMMWKK